MERFRALCFVATCALVGVAVTQAGESQRRIVLKVTLSDGTAVRITELEGQMAEVSSNGLHVGLIPTYGRELVSVAIVRLSEGGRRTLLKVTGPVGEPLDVRIGDKTATRPTLRIVPERVY